jgi:hypothetical protein
MDNAQLTTCVLETVYYFYYYVIKTINKYLKVTCTTIMSIAVEPHDIISTAVALLSINVN